MQLTGYIQPLTHQHTDPVTYFWPFPDREIPINELLGEELEIRFLGEKACIYCGRKIKKTFNNGSCYPCFRDRAENDLCIVKPHQCHFHLGTCRDADFGERHCMQPHIVYLAISDDVKVGITRKTNMPKRWIDQGAVTAVPIAEVPDRKTAGEIEMHLAQYIKDKTNWRRMLKNEIADRDLQEVRADMEAKIPEKYRRYYQGDQEPLTFRYPCLEVPEKIKPLNLDKLDRIRGKLLGAKAQYLMLDNGVINIRKFSGYKVEVAV
ncbi:hypothetical protein GCM10007416_28090 [Kroppenstedtia guangzhouensis]|uniref:DUF2797 domain-containing protein n=1 Tax=Kroppenstedtia guangzhouensis TaxID=1274356 RepID=A0ABQ1GZ21_9BACL|nr:DUF2797 domain-containing protein [Kroppenstedtia guangzhouensis]GGA53351.1 hypothetical protein GCM10007416_28090 [Kroppenstedtia guangzhouensis]